MEGCAFPRREAAWPPFSHAGVVAQKARLGIEQRHDDVRAQSRPLPSEQGRKDSLDQMHPAGHVRNAGATLRWRPIHRPGDAGDARQALHHQVVSRPRSSGSAKPRMVA